MEEKNNLDQLEKEIIEIDKEKRQEMFGKINKKNSLILIGLFFILTVFLSSGFGALFGFLASRSNGNIFSAIKGGSWLKDFSNMEKNGLSSEQVETIKQKIIQEDSATIEVVKKTTPAVVSIIISKDIPLMRDYFGFPGFFGDPFGFEEPGANNQNSSGREKQKIGGGTGFFITEDGMIVTNRHVVEDTEAEYTVLTEDEKEHPAKILAIDPINDLAVIKIEGNGYPILSLGDSSSLQIGQTVIAIGNSLGEFSNTVSRGIISGLKRNLTAGSDYSGESEKLTDIIQTDAAINQGNSGGPLLNIGGEVIGINVAIAQGAQNIGFAIPSNQIKRVADQVKETGKISVPFIGVRYIPINETIQKENNLPYNYGDLIVRGNKVTDFAVIPGSPADKAGLVENDIILEIEGQKIDEGKNPKSLTDVITFHRVGDEIKLKIWHKGQEKEVSLILEERK